MVSATTLPALLFSLLSLPAQAQIPALSTSTLDAAAGAGRSVSLSIAADNSLHAAYYNPVTGNVVYRTRTQSGAWSAASTVGAAHDPPHLSLALSGDGAVHVSYFSSAAPCSGLCHAKLVSGAWTTASADAVGRSSYTSIAVDAAGNPHVAYSGPAAELKYARFNGSSWSAQTVDAAADLGPATGSAERFFRQVSLALDAAGNPRIAYFNDSTKAVRYVENNGAGWGSPETVEAVGGVAVGISLAVNGSSVPAVAYVNVSANDVLLAQKAGGAWSIATAVSGGAAVQPDAAAALALDGSSRPVVAFHDNSDHNGLSAAGLARFNGVAWSTRTIDTVNGGGTAISVALDASGDPHILYSDPTGANPVLKYASGAAAGYSPAMGGNNGGRVQAPTTVGATVFQTSITWSWTDNSSNETGFRLYGATAPTGPFVFLASAAAAATSMSEAGLFHSSTYYRYVAAVSTGGVAASSTVAKVTLHPAASSATAGGGLTTVYAGPYGDVILALPEGAFAGSVSVTFSVPASFSPAASATTPLTPVGVGVEIVFDGGAQPAQEAVLTVCYSDLNALGVDESKFLVARFDTTGRVWVPLPSSPSPDGNCVTSRTSHFSVFQIMQGAGASSLDSVVAFPNPMRPARGDAGMTFANLPPGTETRILTEQGRHVRTLRANAVGLASWDGRNEGGQKAASGVYLVVLRSEGRGKTIKVAIQR